ncbi:DUF6233 domain-containing protein [Streptomyces sp. NPDC048111]|uniref:DUF6233 domain-containing protein n=1 Tax=Streptomyces sp. NPDC048111 TaxID=3365500 RepID=UPI0037135C67
MHRAVRDWLEWQLRQEEQTIHALERREAEEQRRREVARRERRWVLQAARAAEGHPILHRGGCALGARGGTGELLERDDVVVMAERHPDLEMCAVCAPWGSLGLSRPGPRASAAESDL